MKVRHLQKTILFLALLLAGIVGSDLDAMAYVGPGAGFALVGSAFAFFIAFIMALFLAFFWPFRILWKFLTGKRISRNAKARRIVILGLDGLDPDLTSKYMAEGRLQNLQRLRQEGSYRLLETTVPAISPVAWSTFQTGVNPGSHNIFDFLTRDKNTYLPKLSSSSMTPSPRQLRFGKWQIPLSKPEIKRLRKSKPFWKVLGEHGIFSNILRVPITFPPEKFYGNILSAMCTPDLKGSQGTFSLYSASEEIPKENTGGHHVFVEIVDNQIHSHIEGPDDPTLLNPKSPLKVPFSVLLNGAPDQCKLKIGKRTLSLRLNEFSGWTRLIFKTRLGISVKGICRFCLRQIYPHFLLYVSPINIDPDSPALPVSSPPYYSKYLAKLHGLFGTLGLMEDTWALNEKALDDEAFLQHVWLNHAERERMLFDAMEKTRKGVCACVFDGSDRIQHTFWRYLENDHPSPKQDQRRLRNVIPDMYVRMDDLVGRIRSKLGKEDVLFVLSDHGFKSFRTCVNVNTWLWKHGYLRLKENRIAGRDYFGDVDWSRTEAYALGMGGVFVNMKGREAQGTVDPARAKRLKHEISAKLMELQDPRDGKKAIRGVYDAQRIYEGPYRQEAPDLIIGWEEGFRASWESVTGRLKDQVFEDNVKAWSGDHCVAPEMVPGVLFCNRKILDNRPRMMDIAPTILQLFDVSIPKYMDGKPLQIL